MTYRKLPADLPARLRKAGLKVVEIDGWQSRGRPGEFAPVGVLNHHTGSRDVLGDFADDLSYSKWMFLTGRSDLPAPLCQISLSLEGTVYLGASGRANHAGTAKASGSVTAGNGNELYVGIEWMLSGTQPIPATMLKQGQILNAVLLKVLGSSERTVSCHYQTSVTGKWDIGDPNGIPFRGHQVLDVSKFRRAVALEKYRLFPDAPAAVNPATKNKYRARIGHMSMQYSDTASQKRADVEELFNDSYDWITGTEAGEKSTKDILIAACKKYGYTFHVQRDCWVAVRKAKIAKNKLGAYRYVKGGLKVVDTALTVGPGHDAGITWVTFWHVDIGRVTVLSAHYATRGTPASTDPARRVNLEANRKLARAIGVMAAEKGKGADLVFYGGDQNIKDDLADTFLNQPLTSCWDERKSWPATSQHGVYDVIASYDPDTRVECVGARMVRKGYSDHYQIAAAYDVDVL